MTENGIYSKIPISYFERLLDAGQHKKAQALCFYCAARGKFSYAQLASKDYWGISKGSVFTWVKEFDEEIAKMDASHYFYNAKNTQQDSSAQKSTERQPNDSRTTTEHTNTDGVSVGGGSTERQLNDSRTTTEHSNNNNNSLESSGQATTSRPKKSTFEKPTLEEVTSLVAERNLNVNPVTFYAHYESVGWKVGKNPMVSWTAALVKWHSGSAA
jgi:hypothetical protein